MDRDPSNDEEYRDSDRCPPTPGRSQARLSTLLVDGWWHIAHLSPSLLTIGARVENDGTVSSHPIGFGGWSSHVSIPAVDARGPAELVSSVVVLGHSGGGMVRLPR